MRLATLAALFATTLNGCVMYGGKCRHCGMMGDDTGTPDDGEDEGGDDDDSDVEDEDPNFWLLPSQVEAGASAILSLQSDQDLDFTTVEEVTFVGDVTICSEQAREDELLLSVVAGSTLGTVDLVIEFGGGSTWFVDDALTIVETEETDTGAEDTGGSIVDTGETDTGEAGSGGC